jgi:radical SAM protein with 4Fe4S-binding SPASM domain
VTGKVVELSDRAAPPLPRRLQVEVTASCNLRCEMCIVAYRPAQPRSASMDFDTFTRLAESIPDLEEVALQGIGEPLLAPDIYRMVEWAFGHGIKSEFNTNATLLTRRAGQRLIDAGLDALHISLDGGTKATYESIRRQARWETVCTNIAGFMDLRRELRSPTPSVSLVMVAMRRNIDEIADVVGLAARWGIPDVFVQSLSHDFSDADDTFDDIAAFVQAERLQDVPLDRLDSAFDAARAAARAEGVTLRLPAIRPRHTPVQLEDGTPVGCSWPWDGGYVSRDGAVLPCCMVMGGDRVVLGHLHEQTYPEIWNGTAFRHFREALLTPEPHPVCRGCSLYKGLF